MLAVYTGLCSLCSRPSSTLGSNLQALLDASGTPRLPNAQVTFVLSSRSNAYGLTRAQNQSIPTSVCALKTYLNRHPGATREDYDAEVARLVVESKPDLVVLAGWMHILSDRFLDIVNVPCINLHPALPGAFDGAQAIERAYEAFKRGDIHHTGVMVHRVIKEVDRGEPLVVRQVDIGPGDSLEDLETRIHKVEHEIIVEAARLLT
ncbi:formyl transferase [Kockovaella imperatae]|uniref:Phosphoribosylglycinamide formyltransferase n=1 Tax=Kockovaella imperatae TaxID=4999 RepID=A0A1Y1UTI4_9TREE|nr:formyl transferase [Kockovaella imperatae]ORX40927.1 formyl transferase [Kockovaella imperatae]